MRSISALMVMGLLLFLTGCGGNSHETVMVEYIENMESMNQVLAEIKDAKSAKQAGEAIKQLGQARAAIDKRAHAMDKPSREAFDAILKKHEERLNKAQASFQKNFNRIVMLGPSVMTELDSIFNEVGNSSGPDWTR